MVQINRPQYSKLVRQRFGTSYNTASLGMRDSQCLYCLNVECLPRLVSDPLIDKRGAKTRPMPLAPTQAITDAFSIVATRCVPTSPPRLSTSTASLTSEPVHEELSLRHSWPTSTKNRSRARRRRPNGRRRQMTPANPKESANASRTQRRRRRVKPHGLRRSRIQPAIQRLSRPKRATARLCSPTQRPSLQCRCPLLPQTPRRIINHPPLTSPQLSFLRDPGYPKQTIRSSFSFSNVNMGSNALRQLICSRKCAVFRARTLASTASLPPSRMR